MNNKILITGAYGYIGSHICKEAHENGYEVYATDIKSSSNDISKYCKEIIFADIRKKKHYEKKIFSRKYAAVIHCAALILVEESVSNPKVYYDTNTYGTLLLVQNVDTDNFIFASTGGAFNPISPYAKSKIIAEEIIRNICKKYNIFRFFNVAGNNGEFGQICKPSHIIHIAAQTAARKRNHMQIYGNDYDTTDGTCIRDYVHVQDLAEAIVKSIRFPGNKLYECIGSGVGYSNLQVVKAMQKVTNNKFKFEFADRRDGDPATLKVEKLSCFLTIKRSLEDMCKSAYEIELKNE